MLGIGSLLTSAGISIFENLIKDNGENLVKAGIEKVTGVKLDGKKNLTQEDIATIKANKNKILEIDFKKLQLELDSKKEDNRHMEHYINKDVEDKTSAREMFKHGSELQSKVADQIMTQTKWQIPLYMLMNLCLVVAVEIYDLNATVGIAVGNLIGVGVAKAYQEREQVASFLFGSMIAKIKKDK